MNPDDFATTAPGKLVPEPDAGWAFVPNDLPPSLDFNNADWRLLSTAASALGELKGAAHALPNPQMLMRAFLRREAVASSRIEGTVTSFEQLALFEADPRRPPTPDAQEVANYVEAAEHGVQRIQELPPGRRLVCELHQRLLAGVRGGESRPGEFRTVQNFITGIGLGPESARFVPPPPDQVLPAFDALERYMNQPIERPPLIELALIHYQFETIHPFMDGNGRLGRLLITLLLKHYGVLDAPLLSLSDFFDRNRRRYVNLLLGVSQRGEWLEWIRFFLTAVRDQSLDSSRRAKGLSDLRESYRNAVQESSRSALTLQMLDHLFEQPAMTAPYAAARFGVTQPPARHAMERLRSLGILLPVAGRPRPQVYIAPEIIDMMSSWAD